MAATRAFTALVLVLAMPAMAQKPQAPRKAPAAPKSEARNPAGAMPAEFTIGSLTVTGARSFTPEQILAMTSLRSGRTARREHFEEAQQKLLQSGLFETVAYRYDSAGRDKPGVYNATLEVKEIEQLFTYRFEALPADEKELRAWLKQKETSFTERLPATEPVLQRFSALIEDFFRERKADIDVNGRL
ncbi:MAG TPA: POTRA domain-containing protein, partial [Bryobacteraceae bacterium]|nr:POTRA domain-containing protein [Bryobacteraceae bacterium]